ncbi:hypothetical protein PSPO01_01805 [Paraphaeosphaeria sporulosa]
MVPRSKPSSAAKDMRAAARACFRLRCKIDRVEHCLMISSSGVRFLLGRFLRSGVSTHDPIEILLSTEDPDERDRFTGLWRDSKLNELSFVGVMSALLAGALTSTGSWPAIPPNGKISPWPVRTTWYCGIILSALSLLSAADQTVRLHHMSSHRDGRAQIRELLSKSNGKQRNGWLRPSMAQLYT